MDRELWVRSLYDFSLSSVSDALDVMGIDGGLAGITPRLKRVKMIGPAFTVQFEPVPEGEPAQAANYIEQVPENHVVVISNLGKTDCTVWGDLLTVAALQKGIKGTVIDGCCRDIDKIEALKFPIFTKGVYMKTGKNRVKMTGFQVPLRIGKTEIKPGDIVFGDVTGVVIIPKDRLEETCKIAREVEQVEKRIERDIRNGESLETARKRHRYDRYARKI